MKAFALAAAAVIASLGIGVKADPAGSQGGNTMYLMGDSISRLSAPELRRWFPAAIIDAADGRSFIDPDNRGGPDMRKVFWRWLPDLRAGDWLVVETGRGDVPIEVNRTWMRRIMRQLPDDVCLAWWVPSTYYDEQTPEMVEWNRRMGVMIHREIVKQPCHGLIEWADEVELYRVDALGEPLVYDGRHPTPTGAWHYASLLYGVINAS